MVNDYEIIILEGNNLERKSLENSKEYEKFLKIQKDIIGAKWIQFDYFQNYYEKERNIISYLSEEINKDENDKDIKKYYFKTLKVTTIS